MAAASGPVDLELDGRAQDEAIGAAVDGDTAGDAAQQGHDEPVLGTRREADLDLDGAFRAVDPAHEQVRRSSADPVRIGVLAGGHCLGEDGDAGRRPERRLEHEGAVDVATLALDRVGLDRVGPRPDPPRARGFAEQPADDRGAVEAREREPLDGAVAIDEGTRVPVREERKVTDRGRRHGRLHVMAASTVRRGSLLSRLPLGPDVTRSRPAGERPASQCDADSHAYRVSCPAGGLR